MRRAAEHALLALLGLALSLLWLHYSGFNGPKEGIAAMLAGTAERPFIYRYLVAVFVRGLMQNGVGVLVASVELVMLSFIGWLWALRGLAQLVLPAERPGLAALLAVGPVGLLFVAGGYLYDPLTLYLFTLCLALMATRRHELLYAVLFVLMCFCRETAILLPLVWLAWRGRGSWPAVVYQLMVFGLVRLVLMAAFGNNPGVNLEQHWAEHWAWLIAYPLPNVLALAVYGAAVAVAVWKWKTQPPFMRAAAVVVPAIFAAYWLVGFPGEIRVCLEAYPVLYLLAWHGGFSVLARRPHSPFRAWPAAAIATTDDARAHRHSQRGQL